MEFRNIYLVRHGMIGIDENQKSYIGQIDLPLNEEGVKQAEELSQRLGELKISGIYCSDLKRSVKTAEIIAAPHGLSPVARVDLREISLGEWEGLTFAEVIERYPGEFKKRGADIINFRPPGGENFADLGERVIKAFNDITAESRGNVVVVGHAGVNRMILCHALGLPVEKLFNISQDYGCINRIFAGISNLRVVLMNDTGNL